MRSIKTIIILIVSLVTLLEGLNYAKTKTPVENLSAKIPSDVKVQIEKLKSQDPADRGKAAQKLAIMGEQANHAVPFLIDMLGDTHHILWLHNNELVSSSVDKEVLNAIISIGKPSVNLLIKALKNENPYIRKNAAEALGEIKDNNAVSPLINALNDDNTFVRKNSAEALGKIKDSHAIKPLIKALKDKKTTVQSSSHEALKEIIDDMKNRNEVEPLFSLTRHEEIAVRMMAITAIKESPDSRAAEYLILALKDEDSGIRESAAEALRKIGKSSVEQLIAALNDDVISVRINAAMILGDLKDNRAVAPLINICKYTSKSLPLASEKLYIEAIKALGKIKDDRAVAPLIELLSSVDVRVREHAVEALREIGTPAVEPLIATLKKENISVKINAAIILGDLKDPRATEPLITRLLIDAYENKSWMFRAEATRALGKIKDPRAIEPLKIMLNDHVSYIRTIAEWSLKEITGHGLQEEKKKWWEKLLDQDF